MFYVLFFFYGPIVSDTNKCMYVCSLMCCEKLVFFLLVDSMTNRTLLLIVLSIISRSACGVESVSILWLLIFRYAWC